MTDSMKIEHYVVADSHTDSACVNVYFNKEAALEEARWLNRRHHRQLLSRSVFGQRFTPLPLNVGVPKIEGERMNEVAIMRQFSDNCRETAPESETVNANSHRENTANREHEMAKIIQEMMKKKLVP